MNLQYSTLSISAQIWYILTGQYLVTLIVSCQSLAQCINLFSDCHREKAYDYLRVQIKCELASEGAV